MLLCTCGTSPPVCSSFWKPSSEPLEEVYTIHRKHSLKTHKAIVLGLLCSLMFPGLLGCSLHSTHYVTNLSVHLGEQICLGRKLPGSESSSEKQGLNGQDEVEGLCALVTVFFATFARISEKGLEKIINPVMGQPMTATTISNEMTWHWQIGSPTKLSQIWDTMHHLGAYFTCLVVGRLGSLDDQTELIDLVSNF